MKKVGIYIRVSTQEQAEEGYSIQAQKDRLISYCKAKDWNIVDIYVDGGYSGSNLDRPGIQKLIEDVNNGKLEVVLVYKLDRLSRAQKDTLYLIEDVFLKNNVDFVSMNESFDTSTPFGRAMIGILSVFAQLERETIKERSLMGRIERAKEGLFHGGGYAPIGYDYIDGKLLINEYEAMQVRKVYDLYLAGNGADKIAKIMHDKGYKHKYGDWSYTSSVRNVLDNPIYIGKITYCGLVCDGLHEPIISQEVFERVQAMRERKRRSYKRVYESNSLLAGLIFCGNCGARYFVRYISGKYKYYACYSRAKNHRHMIKDPNCKNKSWHIPELDKMVQDEVLKLAFDRKHLEKLLKRKQEQNSPATENTEMIQKQITSINKQIGRLMDLYQIESMPVEEISKRIEDLYNKKKALEKQLPDSKLNPKVVDQFTLDGVNAILDNIKLAWEYAGMEERRNILRSLIDRILIYDDKIKIEWSFI
ncbi:site-specific DNA recombinase [Carboxydocella sporoproducens DSM 16521]|uniref:Site-specific DNA recombinase n=2 Tax=Carboxydocella TaxID=178898 RepID=A0A1T4QC72_9FIRM|nr:MULTISPECIES: recombinase family protein [Carboxydocella]AVX21645.1 site-specific DNA recombinase [Carboxydocella thermautotrophica]SKA01216.1 site-specific DNA recombinase [Carboxydocella sporoproducens DSM 16521]